MSPKTYSLPPRPRTQAAAPTPDDLNHRSKWIDRNQLRWILTATDEQALGPGNRYSITKDTRPGERRLLLVAHADRYKLGSTYCENAGGTIVSSSLDDRLGVYLARTLRNLHALALPSDVLITTDEERGRSSAAEVPEAILAPYLCFIELDRRGEDVVTYDLDSDDWTEQLETAGFTIGQGSFSDVCALKATQCAVNVGIGYHHEHSAGCYLNEAGLDRNIARLIRLAELLAKDTKPYPRDERSRWSLSNWRSGGRSDPWEQDYDWFKSDPKPKDKAIGETNETNWTGGTDLDMLSDDDWQAHMDEQDLIQEQIEEDLRQRDLKAAKAAKEKPKGKTAPWIPPAPAPIDRRPRRQRFKR